MPPRHTGRVQFNATLCKPFRKKGVEDPLLGASTPHNKLVAFPCAAFFCILFEPFSGPPFSSQRNPKGLPNGGPKCLKVQKNAKQSAAKSGLEIWPEQNPKCENRTPVKVLARFPRSPGSPQSMQNGIPNGTKIHKQIENL